MASRYIPSLITEYFTSFFVGSTSSGNSSPFFRNTSMGYCFGLSASFHSVWKKSYSLNPPTDSCLSPSSIKSSLGGRREKKSFLPSLYKFMSFCFNKHLYKTDTTQVSSLPEEEGERRSIWLFSPLPQEEPDAQSIYRHHTMVHASSSTFSLPRLMAFIWSS